MTAQAALARLHGQLDDATRRAEAGLPRPARLRGLPVAVLIGGAAIAVAQATQASRAREVGPTSESADATLSLLLRFVMPAWLAAGLADWMCHRRTRIEDNAGREESLIHLIMLGEAAVPVLAGLFLEITSPVLLMMAGAIAAHGATALWDVSYAVKRREVTPVEQHVHSYLEMMPVMAGAFVGVLHWPRVRALIGSRQRRDWSIRRKQRSLPRPVVAAVLAGASLNIAVYLEELWRCSRAARRRSWMNRDAR